MGKTQVLKASKAVVLKLFHPLPQTVTHIKTAIHVTPKRNQNSVFKPASVLDFDISRLIKTVLRSWIWESTARIRPAQPAAVNRDTLLCSPRRHL